MDRTDLIAARTLEIIAEEADRPVEQIHPEHVFETDLAFDSLGRVELVMALEDEFELSISEPEAENIRTVADAVAMVKRLKEGKDAA